MCALTRIFPRAGRIGRRCAPDPGEGVGVLASAAGAAFTFIAPEGFYHPKTRAQARLLGPCFKTGRMESFSHHPCGKEVTTPQYWSTPQQPDMQGSLCMSIANHIHMLTNILPWNVNCLNAEAHNDTQGEAHHTLADQCLPDHLRWISNHSL